MSGILIPQLVIDGRYTQYSVTLGNGPFGGSGYYSSSGIGAISPTSHLGRTFGWVYSASKDITIELVGTDVVGLLPRVAVLGTDFKWHYASIWDPGFTFNNVAAGDSHLGVAHSEWNFMSPQGRAWAVSPGNIFPIRLYHGS
jgi:hypothetical protein